MSRQKVSMNNNAADRMESTLYVTDRSRLPIFYNTMD